MSDDDFTWTKENLVTTLERARSLVDILKHSPKTWIAAEAHQIDNLLRQVEVKADNLSSSESALL